jgi:hypothetical protein
MFENDAQPPMRPYSDSPRVKPGVHRRDERTRGQTPFERQRLDEALHQIFKDFDPLKGPGGFDFSSPAYQGANHGKQDPTGLKEWSPTIRRRTDREEDDRYTEELDEMKEEVSLISTDLELLDWARRRVFTTTSTPSGDTAALPLLTDTPEPLGFPKTYPKILAHVMKVSRQAFNNPHLSLAFFHYARTSSPESYLVGCLASAYNELIRTRWECFRDLDGVDQAIKEMDANAVSWDMRSQLVIGKIVEEVGREVLEKGSEPWGGERVYEILGRLERKVQKAIRQSEHLEERAKRARDRKIFTKAPTDYSRPVNQRW